jgi:hypothetical protein
MSLSENELKTLFAKELKKYFQKTGSFKDYLLSMKELSKWLQEREK